MIELLMPQASPYKLVRIGGKGDGAYLVPDDLEGIDACFSPGVNNFKYFEDDLTSQWGIKAHMCDFSSDPEKFSTPLIPGMQTFEKKWLDIDGSPDSISLSGWIEKYCPDKSKDLILQMDIEGAEYRNILGADDATLRRFRIIVIELHWLKAFASEEELSRELGPLISKIHTSHVPIHAHPNNCCGEFIDSRTGCNIPNVIEMTYLRRDRFLSQQLPISPQLPHPDDISYNVRSKQPIHLNENWLKGTERSIYSKIKILQDDLDFAKWKYLKTSTEISGESKNLSKIYQISINNLVKKLDMSDEGRVPLTLTDQVASKDYAKGKKYQLSSSYGSLPSQGEVAEASNYFFHTAIAPNQSITIDLAEDHVYPLSLLVIKNRADACQERASHIFWTVHNEYGFSENSLQPIILSNDFLEKGGGESRTPLLSVAGRFISIFSPIKTALHFAAIRIY